MCILIGTKEEILQSTITAPAHTPAITARKLKLNVMAMALLGAFPVVEVDGAPLLPLLVALAPPPPGAVALALMLAPRK